VSPAAAKTVCPWAAASSKITSSVRAIVVPSDSHWPQLELITFARSVATIWSYSSITAAFVFGAS
jgi:hypothetical protein